MLKQIAAGLGLALAASAPAFAADEIVFDPDGTGALAGDTGVGFFDWLPGSAITVGVIPTATGDFQTFAHGTLVGAGNGIGDPVGFNGLNSSYEITFVAGFGEGISSVSQGNFSLESDGGDGVGGGNDVYTFEQSITLGDPSGPLTNFFEIYYDDSIDASSLGGTGYNDGTLIAAGTVASVIGNFTTQFTFIDGNDDGNYDPGNDTIIGSGNPTGGFALLDSSPNGDNWGGQQSVVGVGSTALTADVTFQNNDFFKSNISSLTMDLEFNTSNILPFSQTNPAQSYWDGSSQVGFGSADIGEINGLSGPDIIFQSDANNSFNVEVPEPKTVLLFALGLLLLGATTRRRQAPQMMA
tara:strand:- start:14181 stop:15242 length:1062 start_codon:yes stop_codon:yes gene_type:complete